MLSWRDITFIVLIRKKSLDLEYIFTSLNTEYTLIYSSRLHLVVAINVHNLRIDRLWEHSIYFISNIRWEKYDITHMKEPDRLPDLPVSQQLSLWCCSCTSSCGGPQTAPWCTHMACPRSREGGSSTCPGSRAWSLGSYSATWGSPCENQIHLQNHCLAQVHHCHCCYDCCDWVGCNHPRHCLHYLRERKWFHISMNLCYKIL